MAELLVDPLAETGGVHGIRADGQVASTDPPSGAEVQPLRLAVLLKRSSACASAPWQRVGLVG
jgi:hypothetical protein